MRPEGAGHTWATPGNFPRTDFIKDYPPVCLSVCLSVFLNTFIEERRRKEKIKEKKGKEKERKERERKEKKTKEKKRFNRASNPEFL